MPPRILVVDDDEVYLAGMKELLELHGYEVHLAPTFEAAQRALRYDAPDLLIADVRLGPFNGLQLIAMGRVRIPTLVVSGFDDAVIQADAKSFGADYIVKPVDAVALLSLIDQRLTTSAMQSPRAVAPPLDAAPSEPL